MKNKKEGFLDKYSLIIFDMDGTLINSLPYHFISFKIFLNKKGLKISDKELKELIGEPTKVIIQHLEKKYKFYEDVEKMGKQRREMYYKLTKQENLLFPGVKKLIKTLRKKYCVAIATASSKRTMRHSINYSFRKLFRFISTNEDVKKGKPYPDQFLFVAHKLKINPKDCLVIGDSIYDAIASKKARMDFVGVATGFASKTRLKDLGAIKVIKRLKDILN